jgi:sec-independent protein translocase protein TatA
VGSIGPAEILVVLIVGLIVLGPNRLPQAAKQIGRAVTEFRRVTSGLQAEMRDAFTDPIQSVAQPPAATSAAVAQDVVEVSARADAAPAPWANPAIPVEGPSANGDGPIAE